MKCNNIQLPISSKKYDDNKLYERALKTNTIKAIEIMSDITIPSSVFKYRSFGNYEDEGQQNWKENSHWKDSMNGELFFSTPKDFNSNDPNDCKLYFNSNAIKRYDEKKFTEWRNGLLANKRIGCFTTQSCTHPEMWDNPYFGSNGEGYCIEYRVTEKDFYPNNIIFLKVVYANAPYDSTPLLKLLDKFEIDEVATKKLICLGYTPFLIKNEKYSSECEWRIIIPNNRYESYFDDPNKSIKNMKDLIKAIYLGPNYKNIPNWKEKKEYVLNIARNSQIKVYEVLKEVDILQYKLKELV